MRKGFCKSRGEGGDVFGPGVPVLDQHSTLMHYFIESVARPADTEPPPCIPLSITNLLALCAHIGDFIGDFTETEFPMKGVILKSGRYHYERAWPKAVKAVAL